MKKYLLAAAIIASINCMGQEPAVAYPPKEEIAEMNKQKPTGRASDLLQNKRIDSTDIPIISIKDLELTLQELGDKVSHNNFVLIQQAFQQVLTDAIKRKQQSIKSPKK